MGEEEAGEEEGGEEAEEAEEEGGQEEEGQEEEEKEEEEGEEEEEEKEEEEGQEGEVRWRQAREGPAQVEGVDRGGQEARGGPEEQGRRPLQEVHVLCGPRGDHGLEEHDAPGGGQGRLGVHQEERPEQGAHREGGREDLRRRLDVQARGRHCQAHEVSALVVWSWIPCRSHLAPSEAVSDVLSRGFSGDRE